MRGRFAVAGSAGLLVLLTACGSAGASPGSSSPSGSAASRAELRIVASTDVYADIARQIAGDRAQITALISDPTQDPHSYEADPQNLLALSKADIVIENGGGYDDFVDTLLKSANNPDVAVLNAVDLSGRTAPAGGELNEHVWYDFPTVETLTGSLAAALAAADPSDASRFSANAATFTTRLQGLQKSEAAIAAAHSGAGVAITEPVPLYLLEASGLQNRTPAEFSEAVEEGTDVPVGALQQTLDLFSTKQVALLAYNDQTVGPETGKVLAAAQHDGVPVVPFSETLPAGKDYLSWMTDNLAALRSALS